MILFDPDLGTDLDPDPIANAAHAAHAQSSAVSRKTNLPSARTLALFLRQAQVAVRLRGQVTVLLTTDAKVRSLNRRFRGKNKETDVLSFPADGFGPEKIAGDLAIGIPVAQKQAVEHNHPLATEIKVLMLHGLLHLAGYDHETDTGEMARKEQLLRARLKLPLGLIERAGSAAAATSRNGGRKAALARPGRENKSALKTKPRAATGKSNARRPKP